MTSSHSSGTYNRHMDILPNPKTAVLMPPVDGMFETSYVNANYVRGFNGTHGISLSLSLSRSLALSSAK